MFGFGKKKKRQVEGGATRLHRSFAAVEVSEVLGNWRWDGGFSNQEIASALSSMRSRSRDMHKNNGDFKRFFSLFQANVVGADGFYLKSNAVKSIMNPVADTEAAFFVEYHFKRWASNKEWADVTGLKTYPAICRLAALSWARDGESFIWIDRHAQNAYGISLRVIRPDACPEWLNRTTDDGHWIRNGVEVEPNTYKPVAYWFDCKQEDSTAAVVHNGKACHLLRIPAYEIIHIYKQNDECQTRGIPIAHAALKPGKMLEEFNESELVAARDEANWLGIFKAPSGREGEIKQLDEDAEEQGKLRRHSRKGHDVVLPQGWDYDPKVPQHPNREVTAFKATMKRDLANALDVEYANFANDWSGVSYSSVRAGTLSERDQWMMLQADFIEQCCTPIFKAWLNSFLHYALSGKYGMADYERLVEHQFRGRRWGWVDPLKDVNAAAVAVSHGWKTDAQIAADFGCDIDDNLEEAARVAQLRKNYGLTAPQPMNTPKNDGDKNEQEDENAAAGEENAED